jgi:hypothetical protein
VPGAFEFPEQLGERKLHRQVAAQINPIERVRTRSQISYPFISPSPSPLPCYSRCARQGRGSGAGNLFANGSLVASFRSACSIRCPRLVG